MRNLVILVDLDDTIWGLLSAWVNHLNKQYGTNVSVDDITKWDVSAFFPTLTKEQVFAPLHTDAFWDTVKPFEDAAVYIQKLMDDGHTVMVVTASDYRTIRAKAENLFKHFPMFTWNNVIIAQKKQLVFGDVLIDDGVHNVLDGQYKGFLVDAPHNRDFHEELHDITRVKNWRDIYIKICELSQERT